MLLAKPLLVFCLSCLFSIQLSAASPPTTRPVFSRGLSTAPDYFPLAVWLQTPANAQRYKHIGINLYIGLWRGPTEEQIAALEKVQMPVICDFNSRAPQFVDRRIIVGWMHGDEPDNAQALPGGGGYGPPILPAKIVADYQRIRAADLTRPVMLNLGQGVAWDGWYGRGVRTNHPEDYLEYVKGCDIASFDIYPSSHTHKDVAGNLWYVPFGVERLRKWAGEDRPVWTCIETTRISNPDVGPTPRQVRSEVWMAIIHGAKGIIYFCHQFRPQSIEAGLLADAEMAKGVAAINAQVRELAPIINSPSIDSAVNVTSASADVPIDMLVKRSGNSLYVFAAAVRSGTTTATFSVPTIPQPARVNVLGESRTLKVENSTWTDTFDSYAVHIYQIE